jgi:hypothetical protein
MNLIEVSNPHLEKQVPVNEPSGVGKAYQLHQFRKLHTPTITDDDDDDDDDDVCRLQVHVMPSSE